MSKENLTLYHMEDCPYSSLVRRKLNFLNLSCTLIPQPEDSSKRAELKELSGQVAVPVLKDGDKVINDSKEIIKYLDETYGNGKNEPMPSKTYGFGANVKGSLEAVREKTIEIMKEQGFGLVTEIPFYKVMKEKLDKDIAPYIIMGFCNPKIAFEAVQADEDTGLLLPCNVVIREEAPGIMNVSAVHPVNLFAVVGRNDMIDYAEEVKAMLKGGIDKLEALGEV